jgi:hypothetical protein
MLLGLYACTSARLPDEDATDDPGRNTRNTRTMHGIYETISDKASIRITCDTYISSATDRFLDACCRRDRLVDGNRMFCPGRRLQARTRAFVPFTR